MFITKTEEGVGEGKNSRKNKKKE